MRLAAEHGGGDRGGGEDESEQPLRSTGRRHGQPVAQPSEHSLGVRQVREYQDRGQEADGRPEGADLGERLRGTDDAQADCRSGGRHRNGRLGQPSRLHHSEDQNHREQSQRGDFGQQPGQLQAVHWP